MIDEKLNQMRAASRIFENALDEFSNKKREYNRLNMENEKDEQLFLITRVIKKEVIDLADTMDVLAEVVSRQDQSLHSIQGLLMAIAPEDVRNDFIGR